MNAVAEHLAMPKQVVAEAIAVACQRIAPTWPLDRFIAVNPYWGHVDQPIEEAASQLGLLAGARMMMPRAFYREAWQGGRIQRAHLEEARAEASAMDSAETLIGALEQPEDVDRLPLLSDCLDARSDLSHAPSWREVITHQISQYCAAYFDTDQADWQPARDDGLYAGWRARMQSDHSVTLLMGESGLNAKAGKLPSDRYALIEQALARLEIPQPIAPDYLSALLMSVGGWAAWCAYRRWQARLDARDDEHIVDLLAIRLAWECLLDDGSHGSGTIHATWMTAWRVAPMQLASAPNRARIDWLWQRALEIAYQQPLAATLTQPAATSASATPDVQAVFCIDVRSEVFRRALEAVSPQVQTLGFAGFFGLLIAYTPLGTDASRPQLPGLLSPTLSATDVCDDPDQRLALIRLRQRTLAEKRRWFGFQSLPGSMFTFVESLGMFYLGKLLRRSLPARAPASSPDKAGLPLQQALKLQPRLASASPDAALAQAALAEHVLRAMNLTQGFARLVLLVGHGSQSTNNPHAAGLDCGACCGQTGEVNARALAALLNDTSVRQGLSSAGIAIPESTHFLAALHNTTTDEVELFETDLVPQTHTADLDCLRQALATAGARVRCERAPTLGLAHIANHPEQLLRAIKARANDWAQVRPEWGLANNAAFIVAPRARTRGRDLAGRSFLHDYNWRTDCDGTVLELIMTAPMIVTHWINMQYYASTVDNRRYGSGNKVLHNVVGGHIGVFEGNGGDLRIGLPLQSLHDGQNWMHTPLRLSVFIEAPRAAIEVVIAKHALVQNLLDHRWLYLFRIDTETNAIESYAVGEWRLWAKAEASQEMTS